MTVLDEVQALYAGYAAEFQEMENNRRGAAGAFGLGGGPRDYPCHQKFAKDLELLLQTAADGAPEEAERILDYIYSAAQARPGRQDAVYWMLTAVHGLTEKLIPAWTLPPRAASGNAMRQPTPGGPDFLRRKK